MIGQLIHLCTLVLPGVESRDGDNQIVRAAGEAIEGVQCRFIDTTRSEIYSATVAGVETSDGSILFGRKTVVPDDATVRDVTDRRGDPIASGTFRLVNRSTRRTGGAEYTTAQLRKIG